MKSAEEAKDIMCNDDVIYITSWKSEAQLCWNKKNPEGIKRYYPEDFEEMINSNGIRLATGSLIKEGMVLVRNPYIKNMYVDFDSSEIQFVDAKAQCISEIVQNLGAKSYNIMSHDIFEEFDTRNLDANVTVKKDDSEVGKGNVKSTKVDSRKDEWKFIREDKFSGNYSAETYARAKELAEQSGLIHDIHIAGLISQRNPSNSNMINNHTISIDMTNDFNKVKNIVFGLTFAHIDLSFNHSKLFKTAHHVFRKIDITFGE